MLEGGRERQIGKCMKKKRACTCLCAYLGAAAAHQVSQVSVSGHPGAPCSIAVMAAGPPLPPLHLFGSTHAP
jgi:hypothetical protein